MLLDDKLLTTRLQGHPEFLLRLHEVVGTWALGDKPGLYLQARPASEGRVALDVDAQPVRQAVRTGAQGDEQWWDSLEAPHAQRSVHGITGLMDARQPEWLTEVHHDGHVLAGVWTFPSAPTRDGETLVIPDWYATFFKHFFELTANVAQAGRLDGEFHVTATLVNADALRYASTSSGGHIGVSGEPCNLKNVQWMVHTAAIGSEQWGALALTMAKGVLGAYRARHR